MKKTVDNLNFLLERLLSNATYLGLSESTVQNMLKSALESNPGVEVRVKYNKEIKEERRCRHWDRMPHHPLPNVQSFSNTPSRFSIIAALFGQLRREDKGQVKSSNWTNIRANNYVAYHMNLLGHLRDRKDSIGFWKEGLRLMKSPAFQLMAFNYVCDGWYKELSVREVNHILKGVKEIASESKTEINMRRVYIPKANGKMRPLGVPSKCWRVYLHMLNVLIVWYRTGTDPNQHAYFPTKGVHTAWLHLLEKMYEKNIYEFDLKSFFPSVNLVANAKILAEELGLPAEVCHRILQINKSITKLSGKDLLPEEADRQVLLTSNNSPNPNLAPYMSKRVAKVLKDWKERGTQSLQELQSMMMTILPIGWTIWKEVGVPQGAATSCGLATVSLHYIWQRLGESLLMYADDGLVFPSDSFKAPNVSDPPRGIEKNEEKSGWIKRGGKWLKSLKFLGLELFPPKDGDKARLMANTRSGSRVEFTLDKMLLVYLLNEKELMHWLAEDGPSHRKLVAGKEVIVSEPEISVDEEDDEKVVVFRKDTSNLSRAMEILYSGQRYKSASASKSVLTTPSATLKAVEESLIKNEALVKWLEAAIERFRGLENPLSLLFQGNGLPMLSSMLLGSKAEDLHDQNVLRCSKSSWVYNNLGLYLYGLLSDFEPSSELKALIEEQSMSTFGLSEHSLKVYQSLRGLGFTNSEIITSLKGYKAAWKSLFRIQGSTPWSAQADSIWSKIRMEMKSFLRSHSVDAFNASTLACADLLSRMREDEALPLKKEIWYCLVNRVKPKIQAAKESSQKHSNKRRKQEKEFRRQFGKWPRGLRTMILAK